MVAFAGQIMDPDRRFDSVIQYWAWYYNFDWQLIRRQIEIESHFQPDAVSPAGAQGLAQFEPDTFREIAGKLQLKNADPFNPEHSIHCQCRYMSDLKTHYGGDMRKALAAYNFGMGNVDRGVDWPKETVDYVNQILD